VMSIGACPLSHLSLQKVVCLPFPIVMLVQALNNASSVGVNCMFRPCHGFEWSTHLNQFHLSRKALMKVSRSRMPRPPEFFGLQTRC
jgi:hypothetical protein